MNLENILKKSSKAIVIGIGGGGDIVGTLPTANLLDLFNIEYVLAGLAWERSVIDPMPGPRSFDQTLNAKKLNEAVWYCNKDTKTSGGVRFAESGVSEILEADTLLINILDGPGAIAEGLLNAADKLGADLIIGIDVGGDAIASGSEKGILSPVADSSMIAALYKISDKIETVVGMFGFGSDGELTMQELENSIKTISRNGGILGSWGITQNTAELMERVIEIVPTEASKSPVLYSRGSFNGTRIRSGTLEISLNFASTVTIYIDTRVLYEKVSALSRSIQDCGSLEEAKAVLNGLGVKTELDLEHAWLEKNKA